MKKIVRKLIAAVLIFLCLAALMVATTFAWMNLSTSPAVSGIQISIGGNNTIKIAPNISENVDGVIYNYPGYFGENLIFNQHSQYDYLKTLSGLTPVSTADGLYWIIPSYYGANDEEVINGLAQVGQVKPIEEFWVDTFLEYANLDDDQKSGYGHYIYLDFWIVSPSDDYELRISCGDDSSGSFLIDLMSAVAVDENGDGINDSYDLEQGENSISASARVGFLVDHNNIVDNTVLYYSESEFYSDAYTRLKGSYQNKGESIKYSSGYLFTIYEPNADLHLLGGDGKYIETNPIAWNGGDLELADVRDRLTVQMMNKWILLENSDPYISEVFKAAIINKTFDSPEAAEKEFYNKYLQQQLLPYVEKGSFIKNTAELYEKMNSGIVDSDILDSIDKSGATSDICVAYLEKNVPQRIRMFVWIEGQDADCTGNSKGSAFALSIEFAGSK